MRQLGTVLRKERAVAGPERRRRRCAASIAALGMILALGIAWALVIIPAPVAPRGASGSGNLLINGSFEQPVGGLLTIGRPISWWQRFQVWYRFNSEINRVSISRRQRPVIFPFPPPPPE